VKSSWASMPGTVAGPSMGDRWSRGEDLGYCCWGMGGPSQMPLPQIPGSKRPPPPADMSKREAEIWTDIVDSRPAFYFDRSTFPMLAALCMHAAQAELLAAELRRNSTQKNRDEHRKQTAMIATLSTRLRLSKLGQRKHQSIEERDASGAPRRRLWQVT